MNPKRPPQAIKVIYVIGLIFGVGLIFWGANRLQQQRASLQWPAVTGKIVHSELVFTRGRSSHDSADVTYNYTVNGTKHVSQQISLWSSDLRFCGGITERFVTDHATGSPVEVHYDPEHPETAVLVPGAYEMENWLLMGVGGFTVLTSIWGMFARLQREPRLRALLNDPLAETRTVPIKCSDITDGISSFIGNILGAGLSLMFAAAVSLPALIAGPSTMPGAPVVQPWQWFVGPTGVVVACFFFLRAVRLARRAECPLCNNLLNKTVFATGRCEECGTHFQFDGPVPAFEKRPLRLNQPIRLQTGRLMDVAGFMAFPAVFVCLFGASDKNVGPAIAVLFVVLISILGAVYYFWPDYSDRQDDSPSIQTGVGEGISKMRSYWMDFGIILSPPLALLSYLLYLVWFHRTLDIHGLIVVAVGFPLGVGLVSWICKHRFQRAQTMNGPKPPAFVPLTLLALWLGGTFITVVFLVCLIHKLGWIG
jgi:hypothetical protein